MDEQIKEFIALDKKELEIWLSESIEECVILINSKSAYVKLNGLMKFEMLEQLRNNIHSSILMDGAQYNRIKIMINEARHYFQVILEDAKHFNIKVKQN